jgi:hypothetical protein
MVVGGIEAVSEKAKGGGLSAAAYGDEQSDGVALDGEVESLKSLSEGGVLQQAGVIGSLRERRPSEAEVFLEIHVFFLLSNGDG